VGFLDRLTHLLHQLFERYDEVAVALLVLVDEAGIPMPVPSDLAVMLAGHRLASGEMHLLGTLALLETALLVGASVYYWLGARGGRPLLYRYGRHVRLSPERLDRVGERLRRHGALAVAVGRLVPGLRGYTVLAAGAFGVPYRQFLLGLAISGALYLGALLWLGAWLGPGALGIVGALRVSMRAGLTAVAFVALGVAAAVLYRRAGRRGELPPADAHQAAGLESALLAGFLATVGMGLGVNLALYVLAALGARGPEMALVRLVRAAAEQYAGGSGPRMVAQLALLVFLVNLLWAVVYAWLAEGRLPGALWAEGLLSALAPLAFSVFVLLPALGGGPLGLGLGAGPVPLLGEVFRHALFGLGLGAWYALLLGAREPPGRRASPEPATSDAGRP
jgi:membrane protein DedA with SNARE-associated domain